MDKADELIDKKIELRKKIQTLEWDKQQKQINFARLSVLDELKKELAIVEAELTKVQNEPVL
jgi:hypothetical protein